MDRDLQEEYMKFYNLTSKVGLSSVIFNVLGIEKKEMNYNHFIYGNIGNVFDNLEYAICDVIYLSLVNDSAPMSSIHTVKSHYVQVGV